MQLHIFEFICYCILTSAIQQSVAKTFYLQQADVISYDPTFLPREEKNDLQIYCYEGKPKYIIYLWQSVSLQIDLNSDNYLHYEGGSPDEVQKEYLEHRSSWSLNLFSWKQKHFRFNPFNQSCVGIQSKNHYKVVLNVLRVDYWKILALATGIFLYLSAVKLSKNTLFYYLCGISFGICASFLILIYFVSKLFPKRPMMYGVAVCGWTVAVYAIQLLWENIRVILLSYQNYVIWYIITTGLISFTVCYRWGPVTNERTQNLIRWSLQAFGLIAIFYSSQFQEAAVGQIVLLLLAYNIPETWLTKSKAYWRKRFPPKASLLSNDEYYQQGVKETSKALSELRKYCSSPECNQWKTVLQLSNVKRFASFIEGRSHLDDSEILEYESSMQQTDLTDDDESDVLTDEDN